MNTEIVNRAHEALIQAGYTVEATPLSQPTHSSILLRVNDGIAKITPYREEAIVASWLQDQETPINGLPVIKEVLELPNDTYVIIRGDIADFFMEDVPNHSWHRYMSDFSQVWSRYIEEWTDFEIDTPEAYREASQIIKGILNNLHEKYGIAILDVRADNIGIQNGEIVIRDFGCISRYSNLNQIEKKTTLRFK